MTFLHKLSISSHINTLLGRGKAQCTVTKQLLHLQLPLHATLQPHRISSWQDFDASGMLVQCGRHAESLYTQPSWMGQGELAGQ